MNKISDRLEKEPIAYYFAALFVVLAVVAFVVGLRGMFSINYPISFVSIIIGTISTFVWLVAGISLFITAAVFIIKTK